MGKRFSDSLGKIWGLLGELDFRGYFGTILIKFPTQCKNDPPAMASLQTAGRKEILDAISTGVQSNLCNESIFFHIYIVQLALT